MHSLIHIGTFKINFFFLKINVISHILKFLSKFNTTYDHFFF